MISNISSNDCNDCRFIGMRGVLLSSVFGFGAAFAGNAAWAAPEDAGRLQEIEEITVTAQRHEQGINDVGITVNVMSGGMIQDLGVQTAQDIAKFVPGLQVNEAIANGVPVYTIRGVGFQDYYTGGSSTVGLYFDGVNIPYTVMSRGALFDVERVEVLRGPQGDLYGRNTTAGQINFVSKKPTAEFEAGLRTSFSSYKTIDAESYISGPISNGVRGRLAMKSTHSYEGWQHSLTRDDELGEKNVTAFRGILDIDVSETTRLELNAHYVVDKSDNQAPQAVDGNMIGAGRLGRFGYIPLQNYATFDPDHLDGVLFATPPWFTNGDAKAADWTNSWTNPISGITYNLRPKRDAELFGGSIKLEQDFGGVTLTSLTAYDHFTRNDVFDDDGGAFVDNANINDSNIYVFSQEITLSGSNDNLTWLTGVYYSKDRVKENYRFFMPDSSAGYGAVVVGRAPFNASPILQLDSISEQHTESYAAFGHVEWSFAEKWRLTGGVRFTHEKRSWTGCSASAEDNTWGAFANYAFGTTLQPGDCLTIDDDPNSPTYFFDLIGTPNVNDAFHPYSDTITANKWMGKIGLDYRVTENILAYATVSRGFKSGGFNGGITSSAGSLHPYKPEELTAYEIGAKTTLLDNTIQLNANAFYYDYKNKQESGFAVSPVGNLDALTNIEKSRIMGAEFELDWVPLEGLMLHAAGTWLDTKTIKWNAIDPNQSAWPTVVYRDASGGKLAQAPEFSFIVSANYRQPVSSSLYVEVGGDASYKGATRGGENGIPQTAVTATESYTIFNARLALGNLDDRWSVQLWSHNLTNKYYYPSAFTANGPYVRYAGMPRTIGLTFDVQF
jgi:iron complex outermembrane receptor protein